jgi:hypothetical protein
MWLFDSRFTVSFTRLDKRAEMNAVIYTRKKTENTVVGIRQADHVAPSIIKSWH